MSSGKKGKKSKGKTLALTDFLADTPGGIPPIPLKTSSWADDIEDDHDGGFSSSRNKEPVLLPTAPRAARGPGFDEENIPNSPPYVAYISNLPYDVDEEDLAEFFADMKVSNMRLPKDANKLRGYGYVEFEDRQSLIDALSITNTTIKTRRVRIEVSNSSNDERRGGRMMGRENRRDDYGDPERTTGDWRSGPRDESASESDRYRSRGGDRRDDREGSEIDNKPGGWREGGDGGGGAFKDRSSGFRDDDRDRERPRYGGDRDNRDRDGDRDRERSDIDNKPGGWREGGDRGGAFRDRGGFRDDDRERDRPRYGGDRDNRDRDGDRGGSFGPRRNYGDSDRGRSTQDAPPRREDSSAESKTRPKLQLQPRSKPVETVAVAEELSETGPAAAPVPAPVPSVNIFGQAKPVDTTAREREIEERLSKSFAEVKTRDEGDPDRRSTKEGVKVRSNGDGRVEKERGRPAWRTDEDRGREPERSGPRPPTSRSGQRGDSGGRTASHPAPARGPQKAADIRGPQDRERKDRYRDNDDDDVSRMPKAKAEQTPNFIASNKYSILPDDVDPDNTDD